MIGKCNEWNKKLLREYIGMFQLDSKLGKYRRQPGLVGLCHAIEQIGYFLMLILNAANENIENRTISTKTIEIKSQWKYTMSQKNSGFYLTAASMIDDA